MNLALTFPGCHRRAGVERVVFEAARFLAGRGHSVTVFSSEWELDPSAPTVQYEPVRAAKQPWFLRPRSFFTHSTRAIGRKHFDVLCSYGSVCPTGGVHWVQSVHRAWLERSRQVRSSLSWTRWKQRLNPIHHSLLKLEAHHFRDRRYRKLIALTEDVKQDLIRLYDVPAQDVAVLPNGFSSEEFNPQSRLKRRSTVRRELRYSDHDTVIVFVANELLRKGFGPLLQATATLDDPQLRLLVVGRVVPSPFLSEINRLKMSDRVRFVGPTADVAQYYAAADLFALPTQYEPWGMVVVEAMACGLPVLTSRLAGASVAVAEGRTGELLQDPRSVDEIRAKLTRLLSRGYESADAISRSVSPFSWDRLLARYEHLLLECASS